jgi:hypothetical protein
VGMTGPVGGLAPPVSGFTVGWEPGAAGTLKFPGGGFAPEEGAEAGAAGAAVTALTGGTAAPGFEGTGAIGGRAAAAAGGFEGRGGVGPAGIRTVTSVGAGRAMAGVACVITAGRFGKGEIFAVVRSEAFGRFCVRSLPS